MLKLSLKFYSCSPRSSDHLPKIMLVPPLETLLTQALIYSISNENFLVSEYLYFSTKLIGPFK